MTMRSLPLSFALAVSVLHTAACSTTTTALADRCDLSASALSPTEAAPGATIAMTAGPLTRTWDTTVLVGGVNASVVELVREGCDTCDSCRTQNDCNACDDCDDCDALCATSCVESVRFVVPELPAGVHSLQLINGHGSSAGLQLTVLAPPADTGAPDTGAPDTGTSDTGTSDTGSADTGAPPTPPACR